VPGALGDVRGLVKPIEHAAMRDTGGSTNHAGTADATVDGAQVGLLRVDTLLEIVAMNPLYQAESACIRAKLHVERYEPDVDSAPGVDRSCRTTVVLCHGFGGSARNFRPQARALGASVRFVLFDARGHARSEKPRPEQAYRYACLVEDLASVVDLHAPGKVIVGGLSLGAAVALGYALRYPDRIAGLLLASYPTPPSSLRPWALQFADNIEEFGVEIAGERFVWGPTSRFDPKTRDLTRRGFLEHAPWALAGLLRHSLGALVAVESLSAKLGEVRVPTRIVVGGDDTGSIGPSRLLSSLIPRASLSVLEGAGHVVNLVRATEFNGELRTLIADAAD
jgi:pimeloyl-ACP methyl ester carboxylesterase